MPVVTSNAAVPRPGRGTVSEAGRGRQRQRVVRQQRGREVARVDHRADVHAELLQQAALHLGDRHLEHHLLFAFDGEQVDDDACVAAQADAWFCVCCLYRSALCVVESACS
jgi:hypothetical protein